MRGKKILMLALGLAFLGFASAAMADSISPSSFSGTGPVGSTFTVAKTVTVNAGTVTTSTVDVFFLADTTGSMGGQIAAVKASASSILASASALSSSVSFGVGEYKDVGDTFVYRRNTDITNVAATVQAGINLWSASGGGDTPEANLYALQQVATTTSWRTGSARILVWFGDAPGHDPSGPTNVTEAQATSALQANFVKVEALDVGALDSTGQATRLAAATGGTVSSGTSTADIVQAIKDAITIAVTTYSTVSFDFSEVPAGVLASFPGPITGSFDRSIDRTFNFPVTFTILADGTYAFSIYGTVDGARIIPGESDSFSTGASVPEPATLLLLGSAFVGLAALRKKMRS